MKPSNHWPHSARFFAARTRFQFSTTGTRSYPACTCSIAASRSGGRHHSLCSSTNPQRPGNVPAVPPYGPPLGGICSLRRVAETMCTFGNRLPLPAHSDSDALQSATRRLQDPIPCFALAMRSLYSNYGGLHRAVPWATFSVFLSSCAHVLFL